MARSRDRQARFGFEQLPPPLDIVGEAAKKVGKDAELNSLWDRLGGLPVTDPPGESYWIRLRKALHTDVDAALKGNIVAQRRLSSSLERLSKLGDDQLPRGIELARLRMPITEETLASNLLDLVKCSPEHTRPMFIRLKTLQLLIELNDFQPHEVERVPKPEAFPILAYQQFRAPDGVNVATREYEKLQKVLRNREPTRERLERYLLETGFDVGTIDSMLWLKKHAIWSSRIDDLAKGFDKEDEGMDIGRETWSHGLKGLPRKRR